MLNSTDLKAHLLSHDSFTENNTALIEASDNLCCSESIDRKLLESLDVDPINNPYNVDSCRMPPKTLNGNGQIIFTSKSFYRWVLTIILGIGIAICAFFIQNFITVRFGNTFLLHWQSEALIEYGLRTDSGQLSQQKIARVCQHSATLAAASAILHVFQSFPSYGWRTLDRVP
jgi:hypothetical protein